VFQNQIGCAPFTVEFWDSTITDGQLIYNWDFGDGVLSNDSAPVYTYTAPGTYDLTLTVYFVEGCVRIPSLLYYDDLYSPFTHLLPLLSSADPTIGNDLHQ